MTNPVLECIQKRRAIRKYSEKSLTKEEISAIVDAAIISPSAVNYQPWHLSVVTSKELLKRLEKEVISYYAEKGPKAISDRLEKRNNKIFYDAPAVFFISTSGEDGVMDVGIMAQTISLAATSLGLGSVIIGMAQVAFIGKAGNAWRTRLRFPENYNYGIAVAVGHSAMLGQSREPDRSKVSFIED